MKRSMIAVLTLVMGTSSLTFAQGRGNHGKPAVTGLEHAEDVANPNGVKNGIDNAETKEGQGKTQKTSKSKNSKKNLKEKGKAGSK